MIVESDRGDMVFDMIVWDRFDSVVAIVLRSMV